MLNQTILVGRLVRDPEIKETSNGTKMAKVTIAVPRSYKNSNGEYDTDFVNCKLWGNVAQSTTEYCKKGDIVGVRGRIETYSYEAEDGVKYLTEVVADKITFLSKHKNLENEKKQEPELV